MASYKVDISYERLISEYPSAPTGAGVRVEMSEASYGSFDNEPSFTPETIEVYHPDGRLPEFSNDNIIDVTGHLDDFIRMDMEDEAYSAHSTGVARNLFSSNSIAHGVSQVDVYFASDWFEHGLNIFDPVYENTLARDIRVSSHSWVVNPDPDNNSSAVFLTKTDWLIDKEERSVVSGLINSSGTNRKLLSNAYNNINVGKSDGNNGQGTSDIDAY